MLVMVPTLSTARQTDARAIQVLPTVRCRMLQLHPLPLPSFSKLTFSTRVCGADFRTFPDIMKALCVLLPVVVFLCVPIPALTDAQLRTIQRVCQLFHNFLCPDVL
jgi:hypothetical protein